MQWILVLWIPEGKWFFLAQMKMGKKPTWAKHLHWNARPDFQTALRFLVKTEAWRQRIAAEYERGLREQAKSA